MHMTTRAYNRLRRRVARATGRKLPKAPSLPKGVNANEARFNRMILGGRGKFEPVKIEITNVNRRVYTPDFFAALSLDMGGGEFVEAWPLVEVKGGYKLQSEDRARLAWEIAAEQKAWGKVVFVWARWRPRGKCYECEAWGWKGGTVARADCRTTEDFAKLLKGVVR